MKNIISTLLILFTVSVIAQEIKVKDVKYKFNSGEKFALEVNVHSDDIKDVMKAFKKETEKDAGTILQKKGELFLDNTIIKAISEDKIDVFAVVKKSKDGTSKLIACFEINNEYIMPKSKAYNKTEKLMEKLAKEISIIVIEKELKKEKKNLASLKEKIESKKEKNINLDEDIKKREKNIEDNKKNLKNLSSELKDVKKDINNGKGKLEKLAKQKEKLDKKFEKSTKQISKDEGAIKDNYKKIEKNKKEIETLEKKQADQEKVVSKVKNKLTAVK